jgi:chemotaxis family two-component system response regulator Rcp1
MSGHVVLYAEDEDAAVFLMEMALKEARITVTLHRVSDGEEALAFLHNRGAYDRAPRPHMVLLDLNLPRKSGHEVLSSIREHESLREVPVVIFTSSSAPSDRRKSLALGAQMHITKPSSFDGFVEAIREACQSAGISPDEPEKGKAQH